jgi:copper chaperone
MGRQPKFTRKYFIQGEKVTTVTYSVPNISCGHCVHTIQTELSDLAGIQSVVADQGAKEVKAVFDTPASEEKIKELLASINYPVAA